MKVTLWGTRGSLPTPGAQTARYGGNTSCVGVVGSDGTVLALDAGTGIRAMASAIGPDVRRVDVLLTHLHMDHIQGLGFFPPLYEAGVEVHVWGPASATLGLKARLMRYLSPPLFPVPIGELPCRLVLHEIVRGEMAIGEFSVTAEHVCHPGPTVGYRIADARGKVLAYLPDHEPALGTVRFPSLPPSWTSGAILAEGADLLVHDSQYADAEYPAHVGWGHSSMRHVLDFGALARVSHLVTFHHDPMHDDDALDRLIAEAVDEAKPAYRVTPGQEGMTFPL